MACPAYPEVFLQKKALKAAEQTRPDVAARRAEWLLLQAGIDLSRLVFLDETWAKTNMIRGYGRSLRGQRLVDHAPAGHWKTTTFVCALGGQGLFAPTVVDGAMNGATFLAYVQRQLAPALRSGEVVVMDNLSAHKVAGVREAIEAVGAVVVYLPPYSPDFNPIELVFSKLKWLLRSAGKRTAEDLWNFLGNSLDAFPPDQCRRYFRHAGYTATSV